MTAHRRATSARIPPIFPTALQQSVEQSVDRSRQKLASRVLSACAIFISLAKQIPILEKVIKAQNAGASGVIVADNGGCDDGLVDCGRLGGVRDGGFAKRDGSHAWSGVKIPVVLISEAEGQRLRGTMRLEKVAVQGFGEQLVER